MLCNCGITQHVIIMRLMPHFGLPHCLLDRIQGNTVQDNTDRYFRMYAAKIELINMQLEHQRVTMYFILESQWKIGW